MISQVKSIFHIISGLENGGAEAVLYRLCTNDNVNRHTVISLMGAGKYGSHLEDRNVKVYYLNMPKGKMTISAVIKLWQIIIANKPDVVQTWMYHADFIGGVIAKLAGVKKIFWGIHHSVLEVGKCSQLTIRISKINAFLSAFIPDKIICCANKSKEVHMQVGYNASKFVVIPNGYDLSLFCPSQTARIKLRSEWDIDEETFIIGMVSRYDPLKDHENLIQAISQVKQSNKNFLCVLVGGQMDNNNTCLINLLTQYDIISNVLLLGVRNDISDIMSAIDLHVLSSSSEAFPNVIVEAMASGTPCISTDVGDASYIIGDTGWIVPPKNSYELSKAIIGAYNIFLSKDEWLDKKKQSRLHVSNKFSMQNMLDLYNETWSSLD